jgi:transcription antitermination factor NusG
VSKVAATNIAENHLNDLQPRWFAVRTKFRNEKVALKQLLAQGVVAYLPIQTLVRQYARKKRTVEMPLINNFVFVKIVKADYTRVVQTEFVAGFVRIGQSLLAIPDAQIELMERLLAAKVEITVVPKGLFVGDKVEIAQGPLLGLAGTLVTIQGKTKMLVELTNFEHTIQLSIDKNLLKKLD